MIATNGQFPPLPRLLRIQDIANRLDISTRTVRRYVRLGRLPAPIMFSKICARWRAEEVEAAIEKLVASRRDGLDIYLEQQALANGR